LLLLKSEFSGQIPGKIVFSYCAPPRVKVVLGLIKMFLPLLVYRGYSEIFGALKIQECFVDIEKYHHGLRTLGHPSMENFSFYRESKDFVVKHPLVCHHLPRTTLDPLLETGPFMANRMSHAY
jgi:hypothetical protein